jgi:hypothetical protein
MRCTPSTIFIEVSLLGQPVSRSFTACHHGDTEMSNRVVDFVYYAAGVAMALLHCCCPLFMLMTHLLAGGLVGGAMHGKDGQLQLLPPLAQLPECLRPSGYNRRMLGMLSLC